MKNIKIESYAGENIQDVFNRAKSQSIRTKQNMEFDFNGVLIIVAEISNFDLIWRDYMTAHKLGWDKVGPECKKEYSKEELTLIDKKEKEQKLERENRELIAEEKDRKEKHIFESKVKDISFECKDEPKFSSWVESNKYGYGEAVIKYATDWARLMQFEIKNGFNVNAIAKSTSYQLGWHGITGFMYGCAVSILSECWVYGEDLRKWHNKEYKHEGKGVVNPAIINL